MADETTAEGASTPEVVSSGAPTRSSTAWPPTASGSTTQETRRSHELHEGRLASSPVLACFISFGSWGKRAGKAGANQARAKALEGVGRPVGRCSS